MATGDLVPDSIQPEIGWRAWALDKGTGLLRSMNGAWWEPQRRMVASCPGNSQPDHTPPEPGCTCGIYAACSRLHLCNLPYNHYTDDDYVVIGEVALWGGVIAGQQGWRAQYAYPHRILVPYEAFRHAGALRRRYAVKVQLDNTLRIPTWT